ncbi:MAG: (Fe-S)-binding protein [Deltaproteobacteria bacterium]|nr:(Fe-S)-binding protein [Deltaproteobacteria bacterium]
MGLETWHADALERFGTVTAFDLLIRYIQEGRITLDRSRFPVRATYHDPCNYGRRSESFFGHAFYDEPRWIMDRLFDDWVEMQPSRNHQLCCGGGGGALLTGYEEERLAYGRRKMERVLATDAELIVVPCHSCHGQLGGMIREMGLKNLRVIYLWEAVADALVL